MSGKGPGKMTIITSTISAKMHTDFIYTILIPSIEKMFGDDNVIFQYDNTSCHRAKTITAFLQERPINTMTLSANSPDLHSI